MYTSIDRPTVRTTQCELLYIQNSTAQYNKSLTDNSVSRSRSDVSRYVSKCILRSTLHHHTTRLVTCTSKSTARYVLYLVVPDQEP